MARIKLTDEYQRAGLARCVPGAYFDRDEKTWYMPSDPAPRAAAVALRVFPHLQHHRALVQARDSLIREARPFDNAEKLGLGVGAERVRQAIVPYQFQSLDCGYVAAVLEKHGGAYIGWERGLGKTLATCLVIDELDCRRVLIVCPNTAKESVWRAELERFCPWLDIYVLPNPKAQRTRTLNEVRMDLEDAPFALVVHYEALAILEKERWWPKLGEWDLVVADEAHRIRNPKAKMSRALKKIKAKHKLALSGSIIANHAEELFSPLQWLFPERYSSKWRDWNDRYLDYVEGPFGRVCVGLKPEQVDAMRQELGIFMVTRRKEDELDLPTKTEQTLLVDLSAGQRRVYEDLRDTCLARLDSGDVVAASEGLVMLTRLRQVATGLDLLGDVRDSAKLDLAVELIGDNEDEAFVVFTWFKRAAEALADRLVDRGIQPFIVTGDVPHRTRAEYIQRFQAGEGRVFIGTISTLGESVNLHRASNAVFLDRSWNPGDNVQAADRIYRIGQTKPVTITHIVARDTVDEFNVLPTLANKEALRRAILGGV